MNTSNIFGYLLNFDQYKKFLEQIYEHPKPIGVAKNFTEDIPVLIKML